MNISKRIILIITILACVSSIFIDQIYKDYFFGKYTTSITIPEEVMKHTPYTDEFSRLLTSRDNFVYCPYNSNSDVYYFRTRCENIQKMPVMLKYKLIPEDISLPKNSNKNNILSLSGFVRENCPNEYTTCIISPKNRHILSFKLQENDYIEMVLYGYERQYNKNKR